jgi:hypothetical protein
MLRLGAKRQTGAITRIILFQTQQQSTRPKGFSPHRYRTGCKLSLVFLYRIYSLLVILPGLNCTGCIETFFPICCRSFFMKKLRQSTAQAIFRDRLGDTKPPSKQKMYSIVPACFGYRCVENF